MRSRIDLRLSHVGSGAPVAFSAADFSDASFAAAFTCAEAKRTLLFKQCGLYHTIAHRAAMHEATLYIEWWIHVTVLLSNEHSAVLFSNEYGESLDPQRCIGLLTAAAAMRRASRSLLFTISARVLPSNVKKEVRLPKKSLNHHTTVRLPIAMLTSLQNK